MANSSIWGAATAGGTLTTTMRAPVDTSSSSGPTYVQGLDIMNGVLGKIVAGTNITLTPNTGAGTLTIAATAGGGGSGTVNSGTAGQIALYTATGTAVSGLPILTYDATVASPVNGVKFTPGATGTGATIAAFGSDADVALKIVPQGNGVLTLGADTSSGTVFIRTNNGATSAVQMIIQGSFRFGFGNTDFTVAAAVTSTLNGPVIHNNKIQNKRTAVADANYTAVASDNIIAYTSLTAARTVTVTPGGTAANPKMWVLKNETSNASAITLTPSSGTFDGNANASIAGAYLSKSFYDNGTNFFMI